MIDVEGNRCETCAFYMHDDKLCRRYPPVVVVWKNPKPKDRNDEIILATRFPTLLPSGWCGEWKAIGHI